MICVLAVVVLVGWSPFEAGPGTLSFRAVAYTRRTVASARPRDVEIRVAAHPALVAETISLLGPLVGAA